MGFRDLLCTAFMSRSHGLPRMMGKLLLLGISMTTKVAGIDTPWVVMPMVVRIPKGVTGSSLPCVK